MPTPDTVLYTCTFEGGGYNQTYAATEEEARKILKERCGDLLTDDTTLTRCSPEDETAHWKTYHMWD